MHNGFVAAILGRRKFSSVVPYRECRANFHRALRSDCFFAVFRAVWKMNGSLIAIRKSKDSALLRDRDDTTRSWYPHTTVQARSPLFAQFVCDDSSKLRTALEKINVPLK